VSYAGLPVAGEYHRAEADAEMAARLIFFLEEKLMERFHLDAVPHALLTRIQKASKYQLQRCVQRFLEACS